MHSPHPSPPLHLLCASSRGPLLHALPAPGLPLCYCSFFVFLFSFLKVGKLLSAVFLSCVRQTGAGADKKGGRERVPPPPVRKRSSAVTRLHHAHAPPPPPPYQADPLCSVCHMHSDSSISLTLRERKRHRESVRERGVIETERQRDREEG